jgi:uncharacterized protein YciI
MFIATLTYKVPLEVVEQQTQPHIDWLEEAFANGSLVAAGRKVPRTGGVLLSLLDSREALMAELHKDPFHTEGVADYEVMEVAMTRTAAGFRNLMP